MGMALNWTLAAITVLILVGYELGLLLAQRRHPDRLARSVHAVLRHDWFSAVSSQPGSEVLAVQTLRNSLMSASMTASTAALGLMGTLTLAAPSLRASFGDGVGLWPHFTPRMALELMLLILLFGSLVSSVMAVRYYNHVGFIVGIPVGSDVRKQWLTAGSAYVRLAGLLYSRGLRYLILVVPVVAFLLHPLAGPLAAVLVVGVMLGFDRVN